MDHGALPGPLKRAEYHLFLSSAVPVGTASDLSPLAYFPCSAQNQLPSTTKEEEDRSWLTENS